jgi:hypothetical protein
MPKSVRKKAPKKKAAKPRKKSYEELEEEFEEKTTQFIEGIVHGEDHIKKAHEREIIDHIENLIGMIRVTMDHLKQDKSYEPGFDKVLRDVVIRCVRKGIKVGVRYNGTPEELLEAITLIPIHPHRIIRALPPSKRKIPKYILQSFLLGKYSYETGLTISALLTMDKQEKYLKKLEHETLSYIG